MVALSCQVVWNAKLEPVHGVQVGSGWDVGVLPGKGPPVDVQRHL